MSIKLHFKRTLCAFALVAASAVPVLAQSPAGTSWDAVINGDYTGTALLIFNPDFSLSGYQIVTSTTKGTPDPDLARGGNTGRFPGDLGSGGGGTNSSATSNVVKRLDGGSDLSGFWTIDAKGKLIGIYTASSTNASGSNLVNAVSFVGSVKPGRLSLSFTSTYGDFTLKGVPVPVVPLPSVAGPWYANGEKAGQPFIELFTLTSPDPLNHMYTYQGIGANYTNTGTALLSVQRRLSIVTINNDTNNALIRVLSGPISISKGTNAILRGSELGSSTGDTNSTATSKSKILFRATKQ